MITQGCDQILQKTRKMIDKAALVDAICAKTFSPSLSQEEKYSLNAELNSFFPYHSEFHSPQAQLFLHSKLLDDTIKGIFEILTKTESNYSKVFILNYSKKVLQSKSSVSADTRVNIINVILNMVSLVQAAEDYPYYVLATASQCLAIAIKTTWKNVKDIFLEKIFSIASISYLHQAIIFKFMGMLIVEINDLNATQSYAEHRKTLVSFRDTVLNDLYSSALVILKELMSLSNPASDAMFGIRLDALLDLLLACLSYDFLGSQQQESTQDCNSIQVPSSWRCFFEDASNINVYFSVFRGFGGEPARKAMACLIHVASVRPSLFQDDKKKHAFHYRLVDIADEIMGKKIHLDNPEIFHEVSRFLYRLERVAKVLELEDKEKLFSHYRLLESLTQFSFNNWDDNPHSAAYLLSLWESVVSMTLLHETDFHKSIQPHVCGIMKVFIEYRIHSLEADTERSFEFIDDEEGIIATMDHVSAISRCQYAQIFSLAQNSFEVVSRQAREIYESKEFASGTINDQFLQCCTGRLVFLLYVFGALISPKVSLKLSAQNEDVDAKIVDNVFSTMIYIQKLMDKNLFCKYFENYELSLLYFIDSFRQSYLGDRAQRYANLFSYLANNFGLPDVQSVMDTFCRKILSNLQNWHQNGRIIKRTVMSLDEICSGFTNLKKLSHVQSIKEALSSHKTFKFLKEEASHKYRTVFYSSLSRVLLSGEASSLEKNFQGFVSQFDQTIDLICRGQMEQNGQFEILVYRFFRDIRGVCRSCVSSLQFRIFFDWVHPRITGLAIGILAKTNLGDHCLAIAKFFQELSTNRTSRIQFDINSPNGILIFRSVSDNIQSLLKLTSGTADNVSELKPKLFRVVMNTMSSCLIGKYVSFGVMRFYGDYSFDSASKSIMDCLQNTADADLLELPKLAISLYTFLDVISNDFGAAVHFMETSHLNRFIHLLNRGLTSSEGQIINSTSKAIDSVASFFVTSKHSDKMKLILDNSESLWGSILERLFQMVMEEEEFQWSISRALLPVIFLTNPKFQRNVEYMLQNQPEDGKVLFQKVRFKIHSQS